jgi:cytochrome d ubiquinol oxidase subunit I
MVILGLFFLGFFPFIWYMTTKRILYKQRWLLWISILGIPLAYICSECGWIVAEVGRQPWVIQDIMPTFAAVSNLDASSVRLTFTLFAILFTVLLTAEVSILLKQIRKGPDNNI